MSSTEQTVAQSAKLTISEQAVELLPHRAVYLVHSQTLLVADLHLGKAAAYRRLGQPVPQGTTTETLTRLSEALTIRPVKHLVILGDFLHSAHVHKAPQTLAAIAAWREQHSDLIVTLVRGNHDDKAGDPPIDLNIAVVNEPFSVDGFDCRHEQRLDRPPENQPFVFAGHTHPVVTIRGKGHDRLRLVCFVVGTQYCLVPAFGAFTGGYEHERLDGEILYAIAQDHVIALPTQATQSINRRQSWPR